MHFSQHAVWFDRTKDVPVVEPSNMQQGAFSSHVCEQSNRVVLNVNATHSRTNHRQVLTASLTCQREKDIDA